MNKPSVRMMREIFQGSANHPDDGSREQSLSWSPVLIPVQIFLPSDLLGGGEWVKQYSPGGNLYQSIIRPGFEHDPLGIVRDYKLLNHQNDAAVIEGLGIPVSPNGGEIDGHGYHIAHSYSVQHTQGGEIARHYIGGMEVSDQLYLVHDHTGQGSVSVSIVTNLGRATIGSRLFIRKIHTGEGKAKVGVGSKAKWGDLIGSLVEDAIFQQDALLDLLSAAKRLLITDERAAIFTSHKVSVPEDKKERAEMDCLDAVIAHHETKKGPMQWGIWSKRLEGDAIRALVSITGLTLPKR